VKRDKLAVFWGDTRILLSEQEKKDILASAILESVSNDEILLRDTGSKRLIVVTDRHQKNLFCALCKTEVVKERYGRTCPDFAKCILTQGHKSNGTP
jgi:hypothetical protein